MKNKRFIDLKKKDIIEKYNSTSHFYDERYKEIQNLKYNYIIKQFTLSNKIILDAGCGTGLFFSFLTNKSLKERDDISFFFYVGVDISWKMLEKFRLKLNERYKDSKNKIGLILADLENLPFRNNSFNTLFSLTSYQNLPNMKRGIIESIRSLKDTGGLRISILKKKINLKNFISLIKKHVNKMEIINNDIIEDFIIIGSIKK